MKIFRFLLLVAVASGCQVIGGIHDRSEGPQTTSSGGAGGAISSSSGGGAGVLGSGGKSGSGGATQPDAHTCLLNSDCDPGLVCIFATCSVACRLDSDCGPGFRCLDTTGGAACVDSSTSTCDKTCPGGTTCVDGVCRVPCTVHGPDAGSPDAAVEAGTEGGTAITDAGGHCRSDQTCVHGGCVGGGTHDPTKDGGPTIGHIDAGPSCTLGTHRCSDLVPQTCTAGGKWTDGAACPYVCSNGACTGVCLPHLTHCNGKVPQSCSASGQWQDGAACPYVCTDATGACTGVCTPGDKKCNGNDPQLCDSTGAWVTGATCPSICTAGDCTTSCTSGAKQCNGNTPQTCNTTGNWANGTACPYVCTGAGVCSGTCVPNTKRCTGTTPQTCSAAGAWTSGSTCQYLCSGAGVCTGQCLPGATQCNGNTPQTCDVTGLWVSGTTCNPSLSECDPVTHACKKYEGQTCATKGECVSNFCKDGYCCDTACSGQCQSCAVSGAQGTCSAVISAQDSDSCGGTNTCSGSGQCKLVDGQQCSTTTDCANDNCNTFYPDNDADGYGSATLSQRLCKAPGSPPAGYSSNNTDCCDSDSRVFPNEQSTSATYVNGSYGWYLAANNCGLFDYDCNGNVQVANNSSYPMCNANCTVGYCIDSSSTCGSIGSLLQPNGCVLNSQQYAYVYCK